MAHKTYQYCVAENWGKGFITNDDSINFSPSSFPGNVWRVNAHNQNANGWVSRVNGTHKTLSEAQGIVDAEITSAQSAWDSDNVEGESSDEKIKRLGAKPVDITLEE